MDLLEVTGMLKAFCDKFNSSLQKQTYNHGNHGSKLVKLNTTLHKKKKHLNPINSHVNLIVETLK